MSDTTNVIRTPATPFSREREKRLMRKAAWRLIPFVFVAYVASFLDRTNISFAALTMNKDLDISTRTYGWVSGIFFIGYIAFAVPSSLAVVRFGARKWLTALTLAFGAISAATAFVESVPALALLRFLLGVAEAGLFSGIIIYLTGWFPSRYRARILTAFMLAAPLSSVIGGPLAAALLSMHGTAGLDGWRWLFLAEGLPAVLLGVAGLWLITSSPSDAKWLDADEKQWLVGQLRIEAQSHAETEHVRTWRLFLEPRVATLAIGQLFAYMAFYSVVLWLPQLLKTITTSTGLIGILAAVPFAAAMPAMILLGRRSDRARYRSTIVAISFALTSAGLVLATLAGPSVLALVGLSVVAIGVLAGQSSVFALPGKIFAPAVAAGVVGILSAVGNSGGFLGPTLTGALKESTGGFGTPFLVLAALTAVGAVLVGVLGRKWERQLTQQQ
ncbi:MAG: MFS transporter [Gordonia sp. (in: high G+C Gram-positive bacteria)]|uniref:MFS transporter n=1 Tax=Gordonia sp. (in: high G+C Gram-positive bacteria) TaxID=84139 RepID=UPI003C7695A8